MPHPKDNELIPIDKVVKIIAGTNKGKKARIKQYIFLNGDKGFLNYLEFVQGKGRDLYTLYHDDIEIDK